MTPGVCLPLQGKENFSCGGNSGISPYIFAFFYAPKSFRFNTQVKCFVLKRMLCLFLYCLSFAAVILHLLGNKAYTFTPLCSTDSKVCSHANLFELQRRTDLEQRCILLQSAVFFEKNDCIYLRNKYLYAHIEKWIEQLQVKISQPLCKCTEF